MKKLFSLCLALIIGVTAFAQTKIQLRSTDRAECVKSDMTSLRASFSFSTIEAEDMVTKGGEFSWLSMPNTVLGGNEGDPQIPVVNELIAVPFGAKPRIEIKSFSSTDYKLSDLGIKTLIPRQPSLRKDKTYEDVPFVYNADAYQTRGMRSEPQAIVNVVGTMRGIQLGKMTIEPVSYDPVNNMLRVFNNIEVEVSFDGADAKATEDMLVKTYSPYFNVVYKQLFNEGMLRDAYSAHPDLYSTPVKMLVVTTSTYANSDAFNTWKTWKIQKGIDVDVLTVANSATASTIKSQIYSKYSSNHPSFLVIVGDETVVTYYQLWDYDSSYGDAATDLEYASVDGDVYHDMFLSRIPVSSTTELSNYVNKALTYEKYQMSDPSYLNNVLLIAGADDTWAPKVGRPTINYAANNYFNTSNGFTNVYKYVTSSYTGCYNYLSSGVGFANYTAHGDIQKWHSPELTNTNVNALTNNDKYFWAMGNCCLTANFKNAQNSQTCFGETMIRAANKAAFGYIGSVPESYWYEDYYFGVGATSTMSSTPSMSQTTLGVYDMMFDDTGFNTLNAVPFAGNVAVTYAHANNYTSSVTDEYYWRAYQCFGDGSIMPYHTQPAANNVSHASTINIGASSFAVSAAAGSYVAITKDNVILGVEVVPSSGTVNVPISGLTSAGDVMIVVTRQQRQPYITTIQAISNNGPYISLDSYTPNIALVGQTTNLSMTFKNVGTQATSGTTTVTLTSSDSNSLVVDAGSKTFSALAANATTTVSGFQFHFTSSATVGFNYTLHYKAVNGSNTWEGDITVTADQVYTVTVASNNNNYGTVSGGGQYHYGASCTVTATPADGFMFTNWTQNGNVVSTSASYTITVSSNVSLVANFAAGVVIGDGSSSTSSYLPSYNYYNYSLTQQIYTPAELGSAGTITSIAFYNEGAEKTRTYEFYMKNTTKNTFSSSTDWITVTSSDKVFSGSVTMVANDWTTIILSTPFVYDGTSNVVLVADDNTGSYTSSPHMACRVFTAASQALYAYNDGTNYNPLSPPTSSSTNNAVLSTKNQIIITKEALSNDPVNITVNVNPANAGTVSGAGEYTIGETCTVSATANEGYTFTKWTRNGVSVSTNATYSFTVTGATTLVANFTINSYDITATANPAEGGTVSFGTRNREDLVYDFEDGWQGWTAFKGTTGTSSHNWMHNTEYTAYDSNGSQIVPECHNSSDGMMLSESYISASTSGGSGTAVTPDNYLVSPRFRLGGSFTFYAASRMSSYPAEKFSVLVSESGNNSASAFTHTELTVTLSDNSWHEYTVDLSSYSGMGYVAIRHYDCNDQHLLYIDDVTIVEGQDGSTGNGNYNYGETCIVTATPNTGYQFVNWTENGTTVSSNATYSFTVTNDRDLVANFSQQGVVTYTISTEANPAEVGTVSGAGIYNENSTCTLTAMANTDYAFANWTKDGNVVSTNASYSFTVTDDATYVANFNYVKEYMVKITPNDPEYGMVAFGSKDGEDTELTYDFEDGWQGWTLLKGTNGTSPNNWMHCTEYTPRDYSTGYGHDSDGFMLSESYVSTSAQNSGTAVYPDNYLVSPQVRLGGSITFWASNPNDNYGSEHFAVAVSDGNTNVNDFTQVQEWTLLAKGVRTGGTRTIVDGTWYEYTADLSAFEGMGYIAIHHFDCYDQWLLCVDDITITQPEVNDGSLTASFVHGTSCTVVATPNEGYYFTNWTENGNVVSNNSSYTFTVTSDHELVANFTDNLPTQTIAFNKGWNWWSTDLNITLEQLKDALVAAVGQNGTISIKSQNGTIYYQNGSWHGSGITTLDVSQMYEIRTSVSCEITITGMQLNPDNCTITIVNGVNWIAFTLDQSMTITAAFSGLPPVQGDIVKGMNGTSTFRNGQWRGSLNTLEPGSGYIFQSAASETRTFTYPNGNK